ncbi:hypothetical protein HU200_042096 [Digitaria exilis]|uniref:Uncharacterized protein n=1 Tax=Digitaria exilis TaxID=1010633 RepID=A0A835EHH8_9POAL|nr:hypothetical protein HU200_042096 [Digitaria exilis]
MIRKGRSIVTIWGYDFQWLSSFALLCDGPELYVIDRIPCDDVLEHMTAIICMFYAYCYVDVVTAMWML